MECRPSLAPHLSSAGHNVIRHSRSHGYDIRFNPSDHLAWEACISQLRPDTIVNLVAATNVDQCERNPQAAFDANVGPLLALKRAKSSLGEFPHIVHISTDQVFDGPGPPAEEYVRPCNVYGLSKLSAELVIAITQPLFFEQFFGLSYAKDRISFTDWIIKSIKSSNGLYCSKTFF